MAREYFMTRGDVVRIENGGGTLVHVREGELWLTQERDRKDHYLAAGDSFRLDRPGLAIASALRRSLVSLSAPASDS